jgi:hypothetical protein
MDASSKKKELSTKEENAAPQAAAAGAKKRPVKVIQVEDISVPIFAFENEVNGVVRVNHSWTVNRSYKDSAGRVQRTQWFGPDDCGKVLAAVKQAGDYILSLQYPEADARE